jgi:hypothetical protein
MSVARWSSPPYPERLGWGSRNQDRNPILHRFLFTVEWALRSGGVFWHVVVGRAARRHGGASPRTSAAVRTRWAGRWPGGQRSRCSYRRSDPGTASRSCSSWRSSSAATQATWPPVARSRKPAGATVHPVAVEPARPPRRSPRHARRADRSRRPASLPRSCGRSTRRSPKPNSPGGWASPPPRLRQVEGRRSPNFPADQPGQRRCACSGSLCPMGQMISTGRPLSVVCWIKVAGIPLVSWWKGAGDDHTRALPSSAGSVGGLRGLLRVICSRRWRSGGGFGSI